MADVEKINGKTFADFHTVAGVDGAQVGKLDQAVARQFDFDQAAGELGGINWRVDLFQQMMDRPGVVFVTVGDDDAAHFFAFIQQVFEVGDDVVDAQHIVFGEHQAGVDDEDLVAAFIYHHILTDFA